MQFQSILAHYFVQHKLDKHTFCSHSILHALPSPGRKRPFSQAQKPQRRVRDAHTGPKCEAVNKGEQVEHTKLCWLSSRLGPDHILVQNNPALNVYEYTPKVSGLYY